MTTSHPQHAIVVSRNVMVPMRDGVRLATDVYRPAGPDGEPVEGRFPTILGRTSYDKTTPIMWVKPVADFFTPRGYNVVLQDLRGRQTSEGVGQYFHTANPKEGPDGYDTIEWVASRAWSNGRVGMVGSSHGGIVQNAAALQRPPHLSALWVDVTPTNAFTREAREGGAMGLHMFGALFLHAHDAPEIRDDEAAKRRLEDALQNMRSLLYETPFRPGETPLAVVPNLEEVLFHYYYDGVFNDFWQQECMYHAGHWDRFADIPTVVSSGWYDPFAEDATEQFAALSASKRSTQRLLMGPWNHGGIRGRGQSYAGDVSFGPEALWGDPVYNTERLRWFDRWLKDSDTGVENDPPVRIFVMGGGDGRPNADGRLNHGGRWRDEREWPLARTQHATYYLRAGGGLTVEEPAREPAGKEPSAAFVFDPEHPVPTIGGNVTGFYEWVKLPDGMDAAYTTPRARMRSIVLDGGSHQKEAPDILGARPPYPLFADRPDVLVFQTGVLEEDVEVTGPIDVRLWVSSSAVDTDFTAKLVDVYPPSDDHSDGYHLNLADSIIRTRFRDGFDRERLMTSGRVYEVCISLPPVSNLFKAGHRIRLDVSSSNFPRFDVNPNTGEPLGRHTHTAQAENTVHLDRLRPSHVVLPVIPSK